MSIFKKINKFVKNTVKSSGNAMIYAKDKIKERFNKKKEKEDDRQK